jgi:tripartite ATP-independent transporter DctM subunit
MMAIAILAVLFLALAAGTPVGFAMAISGAVGLYVKGGVPLMLGVLSTTPLSATSSYELITIPMFLLMAEMVLLSGVADDLFTAAAAWIGRVPGGLAMATAVAGAGFGAICGSSTASAATLSSTSLPAMMRQGYERRMAAGVVAISGTLAMLLPTSIALVIFGLLADVSISKLLVSGIVPAIIVTGAIVITILILIWRDPSRAPLSSSTPWRKKFALLWSVGPMVLLFSLVTGAIYTGAATPTEASAVGALGAFLLALARGKRQPSQLLRAFRHAAYGSCMIAMILLGASIFSYAFTLTQITQNLVAWVGGLPLPSVVIIAIILCGYIVLGSFMDQMAILVLTVPVVLPLIKTLGYDPVWFGVIKIVTAEVGLITPPIGLNCFIVARYAKQPVNEIFEGAFPHFIAHLVVIALLVAFPALVLWLPEHMGAR